MNDIMLFIDGSVNAKSKSGYGAYLSVSENNLSPESCKAHVKVKRFDNTSSTKLEIQTLLWALNDIQTSGKNVIIFTDSQNIISLKRRQDSLQRNDYYSKRNIKLNNYELYQEFYRKVEELNCKFEKVHGHQPANKKNYIDKLFTIVDRAARNALRTHCI